VLVDSWLLLTSRLAAALAYLEDQRALTPGTVGGECTTCAWIEVIISLYHARSRSAEAIEPADCALELPMTSIRARLRQGKESRQRAKAAFAASETLQTTCIWP
jgi:hypothetical protein